MAEHNIIGQKGEEIAAQIMRKKGFRVVNTNWKVGHLEIDVIAENRKQIIFIEVKTRTTFFADKKDRVDSSLKLDISKAKNTDEVKDVLLDFGKIKRFFKVNTDLMIRSFLLIISIAFFTNQSAKLGDNILAINMIIMQSFYIFSYFTDGFAYAGEALVGKFVGSNDKENLIKSIKLLLLWGFSISIPFTILYALFPSTFVRIISDNPNILSEVEPYYI